MGGVFNKSDKSKEEVEEDIIRINKITNNDLFFKKTLRTMNFELSSSFLKSIFSGRIVYCQLVSLRNSNRFIIQITQTIFSIMNEKV